MRWSKLRAAIGIAAVLAAYYFSVNLRSGSFSGNEGAENLEATYHSLWTMKALASEMNSGIALLARFRLDLRPI